MKRRKITRWTLGMLTIVMMIANLEAQSSEEL